MSEKINEKLTVAMVAAKLSWGNSTGRLVNFALGCPIFIAMRIGSSHSK